MYIVREDKDTHMNFSGGSKPPIQIGSFIFLRFSVFYTECLLCEVCSLAADGHEDLMVEIRQLLGDIQRRQRVEVVIG